MLKFSVFLLLLNLIEIKGCADFLIFLNSGQSSRNAEAVRNIALSLVDQLEIDHKLHRVAISTGTDPENEVIDFNKIQSNESFKQAVQAWEPSQLSISSKGIESRLEKTLKLAVPQRRLNNAITVIIIDDDGSSAFTTNPSHYGIFSEFVKKRHYIYTLIISRKAERIRTALNFDENSVETGSNKDELRLIVSPFTKCQIRLANELRRKPLPRLTSFATSGPVLTTQNPINDQQSLIVTSRFVTVPVSVRFPTIKVSTTIPPSTTTQRQTTLKAKTLKPKKSGCQFDIVILFDLSGNSLEKLGRYQELTLKLIERAELGQHASQFSLVRYSGPGRSDSQFHLNKHTNKTLLINEIKNVQPMGGTTRTAQAMLYGAREFESKFGGRPRGEIQRHMIVFTDGYSQDDPSDVAQQIKHEQIHVFSVAVEDENIKADVEQMKVIASDAKSFLLDTQFDKIVDQLAPTRCQL